MKTARHCLVCVHNSSLGNWRLYPGRRRPPRRAGEAPHLYVVEQSAAVQLSRDPLACEPSDAWIRYSPTSVWSSRESFLAGRVHDGNGWYYRPEEDCPLWLGRFEPIPELAAAFAAFRSGEMAPGVFADFLTDAAEPLLPPTWFAACVKLFHG